MKVFVQREGEHFSNLNYLAAYLGFRELGYEAELFRFEQLESLPLTPETVVAGGNTALSRALKKLGCPAPNLTPIPGVLAGFAGRKTWVETFSDLRDRMSDEEAPPVFFKPLPANRNLFKGTLARKFRDLVPTAQLSASLSVLCSEAVEFVSEYRLFVLKREAIACRHCKGDFRVVPDFSTIDSALAAFRNGPGACGMDFGVTRSGRTLLIEVKDVHALECCGLDSALYAKMLEARWRELTGQTAEKK